MFIIIATLIKHSLPLYNRVITPLGLEVNTIRVSKTEVPLYMGMLLLKLTHQLAKL